VLKTTARILPGLFVMALGFSAALAAAEPARTNAAYDRVNAAGDTGNRYEDKRQQADDLLLRARHAMQENDLDAASQLIDQAEALDVQYSPLQVNDTPKKLRRELDRRMQMAGRSPARSASSADPFQDRGGLAGGDANSKSVAKSCIQRARKELNQGNLNGAYQWYRDAAKQRAAFGPDEDSPERLAADLRTASERMGYLPSQSGRNARVAHLPPVNAERDAAFGQAPSDRSNAGFGPGVSPQSANPALTGMPPVRNGEAADLLLAARRALALGDIRTANDRVQKVKSLNLQYSPVEDSPEKVEAAIGMYSDLMAQKTERGSTDAWRRQHAKLLMDQADALMRYRDLSEAERLATEAMRQHAVFSSFEPRPESLLDAIRQARRQPRSGVVQAGAEFVTQAGGQDFDRRAANAVYDSANDPTRNMLVNGQQPGGMDRGVPAPGSAMALFQQGQAALRAHDSAAALDLFQQAYVQVNDLDPDTARRLQDQIQLLTASQNAVRSVAGTQPVDDAAAKAQLRIRQFNSEVAGQESEALRLRATDPKRALAILEQVRAKTEQSGLDQQAKEQILRRIERHTRETREYVAQNAPKIALEEENQRTKQRIDGDQKANLDVQQKLAAKVDEFNTLMHERRFEEAELVAKQASELSPDSSLTAQLLTEAKLIRNLKNQMNIKADKEDLFVRALESVDEASKPFDDRIPLVFPDVKTWNKLTKTRAGYAKEQSRRFSERELEIIQKLKTPVSVQFSNAPLSKVVDSLSQLAGVNIYLDPQGLTDEGVSTDTPISIDLRREVMLESALRLILHPLRLSYVVKDEVLKITSEQARKGDVYQHVYNVADLVVPIPHFAPTDRMGLAGAYKNAMADASFGGNGGPFGGSNNAPLAIVAGGKDGKGSRAMIDSAVMSQMASATRGSVPSNSPVSGGPGGLGGGSMADFDSLIDLITTTVQPESWEERGGKAQVASYEGNLSLVISQTQEAHEEIVALLAQLRKLQDLQITIEVRFITLNDNFFERIGVDFDFNINDNGNHSGQTWGRVTNAGTAGSPGTPVEYDTRGTASSGNVTATSYREFGPESSATVGMSSPGVFSADLDIPFRQNSYALAVPQFGGYDPSAGASLGFAIMSDIEAFFFISAAQADKRSNVLQAPKVTLFNGQMATVADQSQSPFVISVIPVVGDFAAAQQPVIVVLSEGTMLTVQAVVSSDRRFVRLTVVPFFSQIDKVDTFTFTGTTTSSTDTSTTDVTDTTGKKQNNIRSANVSGTTVQLPTFSYVNVSTTVSVPDGGTILLGGIKRLSEGRNEAGVPILNKIPYISRLFKNVGVGRETQSLMMMVTPRIIIQEEEEANLGVPPPTD
jgi:general secretion pathway protein D